MNEIISTQIFTPWPALGSKLTPVFLGLHVESIVSCEYLDHGAPKHW